MEETEATGGSKNPAQVLSYDEAFRLPEEGRVKGLRVKGSAMPFGGSWRYDKGADELTLDEPPTKGL